MRALVRACVRACARLLSSVECVTTPNDDIWMTVSLQVAGSRGRFNFLKMAIPLVAMVAFAVRWWQTQY